MKYCIYCGKQIANDTHVCPCCGQKVWSGYEGNEQEPLANDNAIQQAKETIEGSSRPTENGLAGESISVHPNESSAPHIDTKETAVLNVVADVKSEEQNGADEDNVPDEDFYEEDSNNKWKWLVCIIILVMGAAGTWYYYSKDDSQKIIVEEENVEESTCPDWIYGSWVCEKSFSGRVEYTFSADGTWTCFTNGKQTAGTFVYDKEQNCLLTTNANNASNVGMIGVDEVEQRLDIGNGHWMHKYDPNEEEFITYDLAYLDVHGHVRTIDDYYWFDKDGNLKDDSIEYFRDEKGRIKEMGGIEYEWDGYQLINEHYPTHYSTTYTYNADGVMIEKVYEEFAFSEEHYVEQKSSTKYYFSNYEYDEHGNWISRTVKSENGTEKETRKIVYY